MAHFISHNGFWTNMVRTSFASLLLHKLRSFLSILGVVCGVTAVLAVLAIGEGAQKETVRRIEQMGIRNIFIRADNLTQAQVLSARRHHSQGLQVSDATRLETADPHILRTASIRRRTVDFKGLPDDLAPVVIEAVGSYDRILGLTLSSGRFLADVDVYDRNRVCVLGWSISAKLGPDGKAGGMIQIGDELFKIVGILKEREIASADDSRISLDDSNNMIVVPFGTISQDGDDGTGRLSELIMEIDRADYVQSSAVLARRVIETAHRGVEDFNTIVPFELLVQREKIQRIFNIVFGSIGSLSLVIGGIGIMNVLLAGVSERIREIGLRRAVGARPIHITIQFLLEAIILTTIGGAAGTACGVVLVFLISLIAGWPVFFSLTVLVIPQLLAIATGIFFGMYPAVKASRMDPIKALGYVI